MAQIGVDIAGTASMTSLLAGTSSPTASGLYPYGSGLPWSVSTGAIRGDLTAFRTAPTEVVPGVAAKRRNLRLRTDARMAPGNPFRSLDHLRPAPPSLAFQLRQSPLGHIPAPYPGMASSEAGP